MSAREWSDERLLDFVLDEASFSEADASEVRGDARLAARAEELAAFLGLCRTAFEGELDERRAHVLSERVLARTTREDLGWRGDLRLVGGFVAQRLRASTTLRVAAASLLVHMVAVPSLLAYVVFFSPEERALNFDVQPPGPPDPFEDHAADELEELPGAEVPPLDLDRLDDPFTDLGPHNAVQWDRYHLRSGAPAPTPGGSHAVTRLLDLRARALAGQELGAAAVAEGELDGFSGALQRALLVEHLLDEATRTRRSSATLEGALGRLSSTRLEAAALARAEGLGLLDAAGVDTLAGARASAPADELLGPGLRAGGPLGAEWRAALASALEELGLDDPVARHWLAWRR